MYPAVLLPQALYLFYLLSQIRSASAGCQNFTYALNQTIYELGAPIALDSLSCLTADPDNPVNSAFPQGYCEFPPKSYNITVAPQLSASLISQRNFSQNCPNCWDLLELSPGCSSICWSYFDFDSSEPDSEDREAILTLAQDALKVHTNLTVLIQSVTTSISTKNAATPDKPFVRPGQNSTLVFLPQLLYITGVVDGCVNQTLNGLAIRVATLSFQPSLGLNQTPGIFDQDSQSLPANDTSTKKNVADGGNRSASKALVWILWSLALGNSLRLRSL